MRDRDKRAVLRCYLSHPQMERVFRINPGAVENNRLTKLVTKKDFIAIFKLQYKH
jgi:hypothetical protein